MISSRELPDLSTRFQPTPETLPFLDQERSMDQEESQANQEIVDAKEMKVLKDQMEWLDQEEMQVLMENQENLDQKVKMVLKD